MMLDRLSDAVLRVESGWLPGSRSPDYFPLDGDHVDRHQEEMVDALSRKEACVLNANPTGGGKTLSWAAPVIRRDLEDAPNLVMATYPTAALLEDQRETLLAYLRSYFDPDGPRTDGESAFQLKSDETDPNPLLTDGERTFALNDVVQTVSVTFDPSTATSDQIDRARATLVDLEDAGLPGIVLTTPDTLTNLATGRFQNEDVDRLVPLLDAIVVDEFHLATDRARRLLPFHLDHFRSLSSRYLDTFVFLSATPNPSYVERLESAFDTYRVSDRVASVPGSSESPRQILPEMRLGVTTRPRFTNGRWLADNVEVLESAYEPPGQLLVIVDSVREVERVAETIRSDTELSVGRVYGWKREGRQAAIEDSDVVVGNTAVEVGVDFKNVNRLVCTGYEPASILQRLGRMRHRSHLEEYETLLITSAKIHSSLVSMESQDGLSRSALDEALHDPRETTDRPYYDVLCGAYSRYLWERAPTPLNGKYVHKDAEFRDIAANHFAANVEEFLGITQDPVEFWDFSGKVIDSVPTEALFDELHDYRPSSLSCVVIDSNDRHERVKIYGLAHVLRHREGKVLPLDEVETVYRQVWDEPLSPDERALLDRGSQYAVAGFLSTGRRRKARNHYIQDFGGLEVLERLADDDITQAIRPLPDPEIRTDPTVDGIGEIDLSDEEVLAQYVKEDPSTARARYDLGPYAAVIPTPREGCILLWDDAIKAHCRLVTRSLREDT